MSNSNSENLQKDLAYWVAFSLITKIGPQRFNKIFKYFSNMQTAWQAEAYEFQRAGLDEKTTEEILIKRRQINPQQELEKVYQEKLSILTLADENYPKLLKEIYNPPALLYYAGKIIPEEDEFSVAVVGTRKVSNYGKQATQQLTAGLTNAGLVIVSGLALGIDSLAHEACISAGGRTIAVLGSGLDKQSIYPSYNRYLFDKIVASGGLVLSEFPLGTPPLKHNFPQRNRIVAGLSRGVLVVEAPESSGALLTAKNALDQNREVFAVPGSIYNKNSIGPNRLIKLGAKAVTQVEDVLEALDLEMIKDFVETKKISPDTPEEAKILEHLSHEPQHVDKLKNLTQLDTSKINSTLTLMEMKGMVKNLGGMMYVVN